MEFGRVFYTVNVPFGLNEKLLLTRLSYKKSKTEISDEILSEIKKAEDLAASISKPIAAYTFAPFLQEADDTLYIDDFAVKSSFLSSRLAQSKSAVLMAVTLGSIVDDRISELLSKDEYTCAAIMDAATSCIADSAMDGLKQSINSLLAKDNLKLGDFRISPGQAGIPISMQKVIYEKMSLEKIGLSINDKMLLTPQKSIISLTGIFNI